MSFDVNKIIEESVKDVLDTDNEDVLAEGTEIKQEDSKDKVEPKEGEEFGKVYTESVDYFKEYFKEGASKK